MNWPPAIRSQTEVVRWYYGDPKRMAEVEGIVIENNVTNFVLGKAKVTAKSISFRGADGAELIDES